MMRGIRHTEPDWIAACAVMKEGAAFILAPFSI